MSAAPAGAVAGAGVDGGVEAAVRSSSSQKEVGKEVISFISEVAETQQSAAAEVFSPLQTTPASLLAAAAPGSLARNTSPGGSPVVVGPVPLTHPASAPAGLVVAPLPSELVFKGVVKQLSFKDPVQGGPPAPALMAAQPPPVPMVECAVLNSPVGREGTPFGAQSKLVEAVLQDAFPVQAQLEWADGSVATDQAEVADEAAATELGQAREVEQATPRVPDEPDEAATAEQDVLAVHTAVVEMVRAIELVQAEAALKAVQLTDGQVGLAVAKVAAQALVAGEAAGMGQVVGPEEEQASIVQDGPWLGIASRPLAVYSRRQGAPLPLRKWPTRREFSGQRAAVTPASPLIAAASSPPSPTELLADLVVPLSGAIVGKRPQATQARSACRSMPYFVTPRRSERLAAQNGGRHMQPPRHSECS